MKFKHKVAIVEKNFFAGARINIQEKAYAASCQTADYLTLISMWLLMAHFDLRQIWWRYLLGLFGTKCIMLMSERKLVGGAEHLPPQQHAIFFSEERKKPKHVLISYKTF